MGLLCWKGLLKQILRNLVLFLPIIFCKYVCIPMTQERHGKIFDTVVSCNEFLLTVCCIPIHCCLFPCYRNDELFADIISLTSALCCITPCCPIICMYKVCCDNVAMIDRVGPENSESESLKNSP